VQHTYDYLLLVIDYNYVGRRSWFGMFAISWNLEVVKLWNSLQCTLYKSFL